MLLATARLSQRYPHIPRYGVWGSEKILAPIKIKSALPSPKKSKIPPKTRNCMDMGASCRKSAFFRAPIKLAQPFPAPELQAITFTDTRIFSDKKSETPILQTEGLHYGAANQAARGLQMHLDSMGTVLRCASAK